MFTYIFGGAIAGDVQSYLPIIIPGILVQTVITTSVVTGVQLREDMDKGVFDRFRSLPIARIAPLSGALLADTRALPRSPRRSPSPWASSMGFRPGGGLGGVIAAGLLVIACSWRDQLDLRVLRRHRAHAPSSVQGISMLILFPLTFLSNAFVPADTHARLAAVVRRHQPGLAPGHRGARSGQRRHGQPDVGTALLGSAVIVAVFAPLTVRAYMRKA